MTLRGSLRTNAPASVVSWIATQPLTGTLSARHGDQEKRIVLRHGKVALAWSNNPRQYLARYVTLHETFRDRAGLSEAIRAHEREPQIPLGQQLLARDVLDKGELQRVLQWKVQDTIFDLLTWRDGRFEFRPGEQRFAEIQTVALDVMPLLDEGKQIVTTLEHAYAIFPDRDGDLELLKDVEPHSDLERRVLERIRAHASIDEICELESPTDFPVYGILSGWYEQGALRPPAATRTQTQSIRLLKNKSSGDAAGSATEAPELGRRSCEGCGAQMPSTSTECAACGLASETKATGKDTTYKSAASHALALRCHGAVWSRLRWLPACEPPEHRSSAAQPRGDPRSPRAG